MLALTLDLAPPALTPAEQALASLPPMPLAVIAVGCAWCDVLLYLEDGIGESGASAGICPSCAVEQLAAAGVS